MTAMLLTLLLSSPQVENPGLLFNRLVNSAAASKGITDVTVIVYSEPAASPTLALAQFSHNVQRVLIRHDVLRTASPVLLRLLAYHEVCHIYLWRSGLPDSEDDVDACARLMFWSREEWGRAIVERSSWRP